MLVEQGPPYVRSSSSGGRASTATPRGARRRTGSRPQRPARAPRRRRDRTGDRRASSGVVSRALPTVEDSQPRAGDGAARRGRARGRRQVFRSARVSARRAGARHPAGDRRGRTRLPAKPRIRRVATGDGVALAFHAGARVADLEFVQFHPTALNVRGAPRFLISEALRGEGARLSTPGGDAFMARYHPDGDLAPRDVVARSIVREIERTGGPVFLSLSHLDAALRARIASRRSPTCAARSASTSRRIRFRSDPRPTTSWEASKPTMGSDLGSRPVRRRRGGVHGRSRRQSPGEQLAARRTRVRRARGDGDAAG